MRLRACVVPILGLSLLWSVLGVGSSPGAGDAAHVFRDGIGTRARGMGGACVARGGEATGLFWNPAVLVQTASLSLSGVHESRYGGLVGLDSIAAALTGDRWGAGGLWLGTEMYSLYHSAGALRVGEVSVGIGIKAYSFGVIPQQGKGVGFDIGALLRVSLEGVALSVGLSSRDVGWTRIVWESIAGQAVDHAAWVTRIGVSADYPSSEVSLEICADLEIALRRPPLPGEEGYWHRALQLAAAAGVEVRMGWLALRAGGNWSELQTGDQAAVRLSVGAGVILGWATVDVVLVLSDRGLTHILGAEFRFETP